MFYSFLYPSSLPRPWVWVSGICAVWEPGLKKERRTRAATAVHGVFRRPFAGLGLPVPCPPGDRGSFALQGGLPGPADTLEPRAVDICQTCELSCSLLAVISARFPL